MEKFTQAPVGLDIDQTVSSNSTAIANVQSGLAYIVGNTNTTGNTLTVGQFVYVKNHSTIAEGLRIVTASISANGNITTSNTSACSEGGLNAVNSKFENLFARKYRTYTNITIPSSEYIKVDSYSEMDVNANLYLISMTIRGWSGNINGVTLVKGSNGTDFYLIGGANKTISSITVEYIFSKS